MEKSIIFCYDTVSVNWQWLDNKLGRIFYLKISFFSILRISLKLYRDKILLALQLWQNVVDDTNQLTFFVTLSCYTIDCLESRNQQK
jgi:hypothetical protein